MKQLRIGLIFANLLLAFALLGARGEAEARVAFECGGGPACQCECLEAWDECATGLPTPVAIDTCDGAYEECWDENCGPV